MNRIHTRRRGVLWVLAFALVTVPPELIAFSVLTSDRTPAEAWVARMSPAEVRVAGQRIAELPEDYRRVLFSVLTPRDQAAIWRNTVDRFIATHSLNAEELRILQRARAIYTEETYARPTPAVRAQLHEIGAEAEKAFGRAVFQGLFLTPGPPVATSAERVSALPVRARFESWVARMVVVEAFDPNCNCYHVWPTENCSANQYCSELQDCDFWYIGCGGGYLNPCDGYCMPIIE